MLSRKDRHCKQSFSKNLGDSLWPWSKQKGLPVQEKKCKGVLKGTERREKKTDQSCM